VDRQGFRWYTNGDEDSLYTLPFGMTILSTSTQFASIESPIVLNSSRHSAPKIYFVWSFLESCALNHLPVRSESEKWRDWVGLQQVWLGQHQLLNIINHPKLPLKYPDSIQKELERAKFTIDPIRVDSVEFEVTCTLPLMNKNIWDWSLIATK
jgi:hypothetical protein